MSGLDETVPLLLKKLLELSFVQQAHATLGGGCCVRKTEVRRRLCLSVGTLSFG